MSTLLVANVHFEGTGNNRIQFHSGNNTILLQANSVLIPNLTGGIKVFDTANTQIYP